MSLKNFSFFSGLKPYANEIRQMLYFLLKAEGKKHKAIYLLELLS